MNKEFSNLYGKLNDIIGSVSYFLPELCLAIFLMLLIVFGLVFKNHKRLYNIISLIGLSITLVLSTLQWSFLQTSDAVTFFLGMIILDDLAVFFKCVFCIAGLIALLFSMLYKYNQVKISQIAEFHVLLFGLLAGTFLMTMGVNLLFFYIAIELVSISSYILTHFNFDKKSVESSMKYLLFGGLSSGVMLYGMSLLYGFTGTLDITSHIFMTGLQTMDAMPLLLAVFLTMAGFLFKISTVPFHLWAPDIYEGAPTPVVAFFSVVPKLAGLVILIRFLSVIGNIDLASGGNVPFDWKLILSVIAMASMVVGNFSALWQNNAKRMMAYSSIAHAGFLLVGVVAYSEFGIQSIMFYAVIYLFMNFGAFLAIDIIASKTGFEQINQFAGLGKQYPFLGIVIIILMVSLTGLPPTAGFTAKLLIFTSLWDGYQTFSQPILMLLFIVGLFNTVIALFYYLKIPYYMFFKRNSVEQGTFEKISIPQGILVAGLTFPLLILFFKSDWLMNIVTTIKFTF